MTATVPEHETEIARWDTHAALSKQTALSFYDDGVCVPNVVARRFANGEPQPFSWRIYRHEIDALIAALTEAKALFEATRNAHIARESREHPTFDPRSANRSPMRASNHRMMRPTRTRGRGAL